jgi:hypothetical protein
MLDDGPEIVLGAHHAVQDEKRKRLVSIELRVQVGKSCSLLHRNFIYNIFLNNC